MVEFLKTKSLQSSNHPDINVLPQMIRLITSSRDTNNNINMNTIRTQVRVFMEVQTDYSLKELAKSIFYENSFEHILVLSDEYQKVTGKTIGSFIENTFKRSAFTILNIAIYSKFPNFYFASVLRKSMKGIGTRSFLLSSCVLLSCETNMILVKHRFKREYGKSLRSWIKGDTSGYYKYALYELIGEKRIRDLLDDEVL